MATERLVEQIAGEFGGEDPLKLDSRQGLENARRMVESLATVLQE